MGCQSRGAEQLLLSVGPELGTDNKPTCRAFNLLVHKVLVKAGERESPWKRLDGELGWSRAEGLCELG